MNVDCPHCGKAIEVVAQGEMTQMGLPSSTVERRRQANDFPEPWMELGNRNLYLRRDIEAHLEERRRLAFERTFENILDVQRIMELPLEEREEAIRRAQATLEDADKRVQEIAKRAKQRGRGKSQPAAQKRM